MVARFRRWQRSRRRRRAYPGGMDMPSLIEVLAVEQGERVEREARRRKRYGATVGGLVHRVLD